MFLSPLRNVLSFFCLFADFQGHASFLRGTGRPLKVLAIFVLKSRFQLCKKHYCIYRPKGSEDIVVQSRQRHQSFRAKTHSTSKQERQTKKNIFINTLNMHISGIIKSEEKLKIVLET